MSADPRPGVERHEAERLGAGRFDDLPQVDVEFAAEHRHLVDQRDVDVPEGVLEQLGHLGLAGALDLDDGVADLGVEVDRGFGGRTVHAADDLGGVADAVGRVARVDPLGGVGQQVVAAGDQPRSGVQQRPDDLLGRARIGRGLQHHQITWAQACRHRAGGGLDRPEVGHPLA